MAVRNKTNRQIEFEIISGTWRKKFRFGGRGCRGGRGGRGRRGGHGRQGGRGGCGGRGRRAKVLGLPWLP